MAGSTEVQEVQEVLAFDYSVLDAEDRAVVKRCTKVIREKMALVGQGIVTMGEKLIEVKKRLDHGQFTDWLDAEFQWSDRTARSLMMVADAFEGQDTKGISKSAMYALASPSVPEKARKEAIRQSEKGEVVTHAVAKEIINKHKPPKAAKAEANGKTAVVNGVPADDPPDIASARQSGRIPKDIVVEVTEPPVIEPIEPFQSPAQNDADWLASLPLSNQLDGTPLKTFHDEALLYREAEPYVASFKHHMTRLLNKTKRKGPLAAIMRRFLSVPHPKSWLKCPAPDQGGCGGSGQLPQLGQCGKCLGKGYWIRG